MEINSRIQEMKSFVENSDVINLVIVTKKYKKNPEQIYSVQMQESAVDSFKNLVDSFFKSIMNKIRRAYMYQSTYVPEEHECLEIEIEGDDVVSEEINKIKPIIELQDFEHSDEAVSRIKYYIIVAENGTKNKMLMYNHFGNYNILSRKGRCPIVFSRNIMKGLEKAMVFADTIDCIAWKGYVYIFKKRNFEKIFEYMDSLKMVARRVANKIKNDRFTIKNDNEYERAVTEDIGIIRKLAEMHRNKSIERLEYGKMENAIEKHKLMIEFDQNKRENGKPIIEFKRDVKWRWQFFKLLAEDYFQSVTTKSKYVSTAKRIREKVGRKPPKANEEKRGKIKIRIPTK